MLGKYAKRIEKIIFSERNFKVAGKWNGNKFLKSKYSRV